MGKPLNHIQEAACRCGPPPERCVAGEEVLTQLGWRNRRRQFRNQPRIVRELGISVLRGELSAEDAARYVLYGPPTGEQLAIARVRRTTAFRLRQAGFALVHTPGAAGKDVHCTVSWPDTDPLAGPQVPWPPDVSARFDSCFNEKTEAQTDES